MLVFSLPLLFGLFLSLGPTAAPPNLVQNPSFELDADGDRLPDGWVPQFLTGRDRLVPDAYYGRRGFLIVGNPAGPKHLIQNLGRFPAGTAFTVSGWSKADSPSPAGGKYAVGLHAYYLDGSHGYILAYFSPTTHDWEFASASGVLAQDAEKVVVGTLYQRQTGWAIFDGVAVTSP